MPLPVLPSVLRVTVAGKVSGGGRWSNTYHFDHTGGGAIDGPAVAAMAVPLLALYGASVIGNCVPTTTLDELQAVPLDGTSGAFTVPAALVGLAGGNPLPAEVAEVMTLRTADRGRRARGRVFLPALAAIKADATGNIDPAVVIELVAAFNVMRAAMTALGWTLGVASYGQSVKLDKTVTPHRRVVTTWSPGFTPVTLVTMDNRFDVIRGRKT